MIDGDTHLSDVVRARTVAGTQTAADELGLPLVVVRSDLRSLFDPHTRWDYDTHGAVLAGTGYLLRNGIGRVTIAATNSWPDAIPYGSHPTLDPLWSTPHLRVVHHLPEERRWERTARVAADPVARRNIDVCWEARQTGNCGRCQKCLMTMMSLHLSGRTGWEGCFDVPWDPANLATIGHSNPTPTLICIEHCDAVGLSADPIRQRWEQIEPGEAPYVYRRIPTGPRVPIRRPSGEPADPPLVLAIGRLLAPLGCRVDHLAEPDAAGLVASLRDGSVQVCTDGREPVTVTSPADLLGPLAALGVDPAPEAAFDPNGQRWPDDAWIALRRSDPASLEPPS